MCFLEVFSATFLMVRRGNSCICDHCHTGIYHQAAPR